ncbi:MAG: hypothetical protein CMH57_07660 [Myxococcales bacterium]|nr:hypothetical protein [Myxococcales bacterium]
MAAAVAFGSGSCQDASESDAMAKRISSRSELIGGPGALGDIGDFLIENDKIRVVIQDKGFSRGFGVYGGSLIDADLVRPTTQEVTGRSGGNGRDQFGELFPIFFLQALVPEEIEVLNDGADGNAASIRVVGHGGDFLTLARVLNQLVINSHEVDPNQLFNGDPDIFQGVPKLKYETIYELEPGSRHVRIRARLTNITDGVLEVPPPEAQSLLSILLGGDGKIDVPLGTVLLFGGGNNVFQPRTGYNLRFALEDSYTAEGLDFPALPGLVSPVITTPSRNGISYGFIFQGEDEAVCDVENAITCCFNDHEVCSQLPADICQRDGGEEVAAAPEEFAVVDLSYKTGCQIDFLKNQTNEDGANAYEAAYAEDNVQVAGDSMLVPFVASAFTGVFYTQAPQALLPGDSFEYVTYFVVGDGDAASVLDEVQEIRGAPGERIAGLVNDEVTGEPVGAGTSVLVYNAQEEVINQFFTDDSGQFLGRMAPGSYFARVQRDPVLSKLVPFEIKAGEGAYLQLARPSAATVSVRVRDKAGQDLPAKVTVVGWINPQFAGQNTRDYLFDLEAGERWRITDFIPDDPNNPDTLRYIETSGYTEDGLASLRVRPNQTYEVYVSRGLEYDVQRAEIGFVGPGEVKVVSTVLSRVVDTEGYISGDFHLHAAPSLDSSLPLDERVLSAAGEGLEFPVATDHNFVTNYKPIIERNGLEPWMNTVVGLELTTLESGHFNGFPLNRKVEEITKGSFEWSQRTPAEIFTDLKELGELGPEKTIVQVNHSRDSILGYFAQFEVDALTGEPAKPVTGELSGLVDVNGPTFRQYRDADGGECYPESGDLSDAEKLWGQSCSDRVGGRASEPNDAPDQATEVLYVRDGRMTINTARLCISEDKPTDEDWYRVSLKEPDLVQVRLNTQGAGAAFAAALLESDGATVVTEAVTDGGALELLSGELPAAEYLIRVTAVDINAIAVPEDPTAERAQNYTLNVLVTDDPNGEDVKPGPTVLGGCLLVEKVNKFSFDFNAMEVINGKLVEQFRSFRMPESIDGLNVPEDFLANQPQPGEILCDGGEVAHPGMVDDWFNLLNQGKKVIGVGNSDSHDTEGEEPGYPRTYFRVGMDDPREVGAEELVEAFQNHRLSLTNGPFVELFVNEEPIGSKIEDLDKIVEVRMRIQAPEWVQVSQATLIVNGEPAETFDVTMEPNGKGGMIFSTTTTLTLDRDAWMVLEVSGDRSLFPVVTPVEVPPVLLDDAIAALAGGGGEDDGGGGLSLGSLFGGSSLGELEPGLTRIITAYALTNPIWVDVDGQDLDGDGENFDAPGVAPLECVDGAYAPTIKPPEEGDAKASPRRPEVGGIDIPTRRIQPKVVPSMWFPRVKGDMHDVRVIFEQLSAHGHGGGHQH